MPDEKHYSLSDDQIKTDYRTDPSFLPIVMREVEALEGRLKNVADGEQVSVPVESLRTMQMGMLAMAKNQTELARAFEGSHGDRGSNCDYNPFKKIDFS
jgi:hypothetical protein